MLRNCFYQHIGCLIPNQSKNGIDLQMLCAINLTKSRDIFEKYIEIIPPHLFPYLLQAIIHYNYSKCIYSQEITCFSADSITSMIQMWPFEVLILRDHLDIPSVFAKKSVVSLRNNKIKYDKFLSELVEEMIQSFVYQRKCIPHKRAHMKLRRLDVSHVGVDIQEFISEYYLKPEYWREDHMGVTRELMCDILLCYNYNTTSLWRHLTANQRLTRNGSLVFRFIKISIQGLGPDEVIKIVNSLNIESLNCLELGSFPLNSEFLDQTVPSSFNRSLQGLNLGYTPRMSNDRSMRHLANYKSLHQLDVSGLRIEEGWGVLAALPLGLTYLCMRHCSLIPSDILTLVGKHSSTLRQLDFSGVRMDSDLMFDALSILVSRMEVIEILELEICSLNLVHWDRLDPFIHSMSTNCPHLAILQMSRNYFNTSFLLNRLVSIGCIESLRLVSLSVPRKVYGDFENYANEDEVRNVKRTFQTGISSMHSDLIVNWS